MLMYIWWHTCTSSHVGEDAESESCRSKGLCTLFLVFTHTTCGEEREPETCRSKWRRRGEGRESDTCHTLCQERATSLRWCWSAARCPKAGHAILRAMHMCINVYICICVYIYSYDTRARLYPHASMGAPTTKTAHISIMVACNGLRFPSMGTSLSKKQRRNACLQFIGFVLLCTNLAHFSYHPSGANAQRALVHMKNAMLHRSVAMLEAKAWLVKYR